MEIFPFEMKVKRVTQLFKINDELFKTEPSALQFCVYRHILEKRAEFPYRPQPAFPH